MNCYLLHVPRRSSQPASNLGGSVIHRPGLNWLDSTYRWLEITNIICITSISLPIPTGFKSYSSYLRASEQIGTVFTCLYFLIWLLNFSCYIFGNWYARKCKLEKRYSFCNPWCVCQPNIDDTNWWNSPHQNPIYFFFCLSSFITKKPKNIRISYQIYPCNVLTLILHLLGMAMK